MNRPRVLIAFGMLLGASIGFADGSIGLRVWSGLGQPDFFIRRGWEMSYVVFVTFSGTLAGILYGGWLIRISRSCAKKLRLGCIYCCSMVMALLFFFFVHDVVIANRAPLWFIPEIMIFVLSGILAKYISNREGLP